MNANPAILNWGEIAYPLAHTGQKEILQKCLEGEVGDRLIFCSHPPVVTLGKKSGASELCGWKGPVYHTERGGKATYHGPGQVVVYPIINLRRRGHNLAGLLNALEQAVVRTLNTYQIFAEGNSRRGVSERTGVWVGDKKVASIGLAVKRWVSWHGLAVNLYRDPLAFQGVIPCGLDRKCMTSVEDLLEKKIPRREFEERFAVQFLEEIRELK